MSIRIERTALQIELDADSIDEVLEALDHVTNAHVEVMDSALPAPSRIG